MSKFLIMIKFMSINIARFCEINNRTLLPHEYSQIYSKESCTYLPGSGNNKDYWQHQEENSYIATLHKSTVHAVIQISQLYSNSSISYLQ